MPIHILTLSKQSRVVIPAELRSALGLRPGQKLLAMAEAGRLTLLPMRPIREMRGFLRGIRTHVRRSRAK
jgi:AbrB family looped-hinge helix DNA binding protein